METEEIALVRVLASTDRKHRPFNLIDVADSIKILIKHYGKLTKVSELVGISPGMLNQFLKVEKLSPQALSLVTERTIDSVSIVNSLARLSENDQNLIAEYVVNGQLNSLELRLLFPLISNMPGQPIELLIQKLKDAQNIKISVIKIPVSETSMNNAQLLDKFNKVAGAENVNSVGMDGDTWVVKLTPKGEKNIKAKAKAQKKTFAAFVYNLLD